MGRCFFGEPFYHVKHPSIVPLAAAALIGVSLSTASLVAADNDALQKPADNRFKIDVLVEATLDEPMVFEVLPDGRVYIAERKGALKVYDPATASVKPMGFLAVNRTYTDKNGGTREAEQGLVGMTIDPDFEENGHIYLYYYHPTEEKAVFSRWEVRDDLLVANSEKVMMDWYAQRETCCHTGGGMAWDDEGNLFITVGNNTGNTLTSHTDERPGRENWDDQRATANTMSLEGKILRIHPEPDGTYTIPEGNLYPPGTPNTRPEIYTMGHRNVWRVAIDSETGYIYFSEVGPDTREQNEKYALGFDEFNQARGPGFFGWPYFVGDRAYPVYDYAADEPRPPKDPAKPTNLSPNNTGLKELPPLSPPFVYYPYAESELFPELGTGGRSATGGPIFRRADFKDAAHPFPDYFEGKWLASEFSRRFIVAIDIDENGDYAGMERFLPDYRPVAPIDMKFGPDGDLYVLEYGSTWFRQSPDSKLVRIRYEGGNRKPIAFASADRVGGVPPFEARLSATGTEDYDGDPLTYRWEVGTESEPDARVFEGERVTVPFNQAGVFSAKLIASDPAGESDTRAVQIVSGNEPPKVDIKVAGNQSFFFPDRPFNYEVSVADREDGSVSNGKIAANQVAFSIDYASEGFDIADLLQVKPTAGGGEKTGQFAVARALATKGNCNACHTVDTKLVGPSFRQIAEKYKGDPDAQAMLAKKVITGGAGVWGPIPMPPNALISESDANTITKYILSINDAIAPRLSLAGSFNPAIPAGDNGRGAYVLRAVYTDRGAGNIPALTGDTAVILKSPSLSLTAADQLENVETRGPMTVARGNSRAVFKQLDLAGIRTVEVLGNVSERGRHRGGHVELRLDSPTGKLLGKTTIDSTNGEKKGVIEIEETTGRHDVYLVFKADDDNAETRIAAINGIQFRNR